MNIDSINLLRLYSGYGKSDCALFYFFRQSLALAPGELLRIINTAWRARQVEYHSRGHERAGHSAAPHFISARDEPVAFS
jgi:hypothetical protein